MNCKGVPTPLEYYLLTSVLSAIYAPLTVIGNLLMILTILFDPLKELRTFSNLVYTNSLISDFLFGLLIDPYRAWGNKIKSDGINMRKKYPYTPYLGRMCHILFLAGYLVSLFSLTAMSAHLMIVKDKNGSKLSYPVIALVSLFIWILATGLAFFYYAYGMKDVELVICSATTIACLIAIIANYFILYQPAKRLVAQIHATTSGSSGDNKAKAQDEKAQTVLTMESKAKRGDGNNAETGRNDEAGKVEDGETFGTINNDGKRSATEGSMQQRLRSIEALLLYYVILFIFAASSFVVIYAAKYDGIDLPCTGWYHLKGWKMMFMVTHKAVNPFICLLAIKSFRRGCLHLLRLKTYSRVGPMA